MSQEAIVVVYTEQVWQHVPGDDINEAGEIFLHAAERSVPDSDVCGPFHLVRR